MTRGEAAARERQGAAREATRSRPSATPPSRGRPGRRKIGSDRDRRADGSRQRRGHDEAEEHPVDAQRPEPGRPGQAAAADQRRDNAVKTAPPKPGDLASAKASVLQAQIQLAQARKALRETTLRAPISGVVATVDGSVGDTVSARRQRLLARTRARRRPTRASSARRLRSSLITITARTSCRSSRASARAMPPRSRSASRRPRRSARCPASSLAAKVIAIDSTATTVSNVVTYNVTFALLGHEPQAQARHDRRRRGRHGRARQRAARADDRGHRQRRQRPRDRDAQWRAGHRRRSSPASRATMRPRSRAGCGPATRSFCRRSTSAGPRLELLDRRHGRRRCRRGRLQGGGFGGGGFGGP